MRSVLVALLFSLAACGGTSTRDDFAVSACPEDVTSVKDGDPCGAADQQCSTCDPGCGECTELFCHDGAWTHVRLFGTCDLGPTDAN